MQTRVTLDNELLAQASAAMPVSDLSVLLHEGLNLIVQREAARRLTLLGGSAPNLRLPRRRRQGQAPQQHTGAYNERS